MKGEIFNLMESFVDKNFGEFSFQDIVEGIHNLNSRVYISPQTYADDDFFKIFTSFCEKFNLDSSEAQRQFGTHSFLILKSKVKKLFERFNSFSEMIKSIDSIIHVEVSKLLPGALTPKIILLSEKDGVLTLEYKSERSLCFFMEGLLIGAAKDFNVKVKIEQSQCKVIEDHPSCIFKVRVES